MLESRNATTHANRPTFQPSNLVEPFNFGSWEISCQNRSIILAGACAADRSPLAHPHAVSRAGARGNEARDLAVGLRHRQLERGTREQAIRVRAQHRADVRPGNPNVATL